MPIYVKEFSAVSQFNKLAIKKHLEIEFGIMNDAAEISILDLGCGSRPYRDLYQNSFSFVVSGDYELRDSDISIVLDAAKLPFEDDSFDVILFCEVIEHVADAESTFSEISRVLKPGGKLLIAWPFNYMLHEVPNDYRRYTEFGMAQELAAVGMRIEQISRRGDTYVILLAIIEFLFRGGVSKLGKLSYVGGLFSFLGHAMLKLFFGNLNRLLIRYRFRIDEYNYNQPEEPVPLNSLTEHWTLGYTATVKKL